jgi:hypothetical protein
MVKTPIGELETSSALRSVEERFFVEAKREDADGNVTDVEEGEDPAFYGVYERLDDGAVINLAGFECCEDAEGCKDAIVDVLSRWTEEGFQAKGIAQ